MRENRKVEVIICDICHMEIDEFDKKYSAQVPFNRMLGTSIDICKDCYYDLKDYFEPIFREEFRFEEEGK